MCGICGLCLDDDRGDVDPAVLRRMSAAIFHRGPDEAGSYVEGAVGLGARRLAIIDVAGGQQPIHNEDETLHVVYNGEIYNYRELKRDLERHGHVFATRSDTEVVVHAYEEDGLDCVRRFRGMFAFALWDSKRRSLVLAVDRFGIKPLYYARCASGIVFGSELKCLLSSGLVDREVDPDALAAYFTFNFIPPPATIFSGVRKLAPGSLLLWHPNGEPEVRRYWDDSSASSVVTRARPQERRRELRSALTDAVKSHLVSDVPVGAFLSGGIDSSVVVALMSQLSDARVRTFSIGFRDPRYSELEKARAVARHCDTEHHELILEPETVDLLPKLVDHFGEPFADASALPTYYVSKLAREHVKVVLSGDGGDELFLGYPMFNTLELSRYIQRLPSGALRAAAALPSLLPRTSNPRWNDWLQTFQRRTSDLALSPDAAFRRKMTATGLSAVAPLLSSDLRRRLEEREPFQIVNQWLRHYQSRDPRHPLERFVRTSFQVSLAGDMLVKVDRASMANSLEVRVPLLDHRLADHVAMIPIAERLPRWQLKGLLKRTMADALPAQIINQRKKGFTVPLAAWFRGGLEQFALGVLLSESARKRGFFNPAAVERLVRAHREGSRDLGSVIWSLLVFELWCQRVLAQ